MPGNNEAQPATPVTVRAFVALSWLLGWWWMLDGLRCRLFGDYTRLGGQLGPWAAVVERLGVPPADLSWPFVVLGTSLVAASFGVILRRRWGYVVGAACAMAGVLYLGFGTIVGLGALAALALPTTRAYVFGEDRNAH